MSSTTQTEQRHTLPTPESAREKNKESLSSGMEPIEGTPFYMVSHEGEYAALFSNKIITKKHSTKEAVLDEINEEMWLIVMRVCAITHERIAEETIKLYSKTSDETEYKS